MMFRRRKGRGVFRRRRTPLNAQHYREHKELAREIVHERLSYWNQFYGFTYRRVSIKNQRTCWGSCSELGNLNFNYRIIFLPEHLMDYVIVHELCHIAELSHSKIFWAEVERAVPDFKERRTHLRKMTRIPKQGFPSSVFAVRFTAVGEK